MYKTRIEKLKQELGKGQALLVSSDPNVFYLTGYNTDNGYVVVTREKACFFTDFRYIEKARSVIDSCRVLMFEHGLFDIGEILTAEGVRELYVESETVSLKEYDRFRASFENVEVLREDRFDVLLSEMRSVKTFEELEHIRSAQKLTDETFSYILQRISEGRSEKDVMLDMEFYMRRLGSEGVSFDFIVVSGCNSSLPHGVPTDKKIQKGDFITMDFGAVVNGYHSDMTRTVALHHVDEVQRLVYDTVLKAQRAAINAVRAGVPCVEIDKAARDLIDQAGFKGCFGHGLGHGVGIQIHESPNFNTRCSTLTRPGNVMTVEPGIYLENRFGVRIEDMVFVTEEGCEDITASPRELIIL